MAGYILNINFTDDQLDAIHSTNSNIIIAKPSGGDSPNVAWQSFKPLQSNSLAWDELYGIYVSNSSIEHGATLDQLSNTSIGSAMNMLYTFEPSGKIDGPIPGGEANSFSLLNSYDSQDFMTVGLFQDAVVNGTEIIGNATSAAPILLASTATMTPYTTIYIWIQSKVESNSVVTTVTSPMTELKFGGGVNALTVLYDSVSGQFPTSN